MTSWRSAVWAYCCDCRWNREGIGAHQSAAIHAAETGHPVELCETRRRTVALDVEVVR